MCRLFDCETHLCAADAHCIQEVKMDLIYKSTRNNQETATASEAILKGLAGEGEKGHHVRYRRQKD